MAVMKTKTNSAKKSKSVDLTANKEHTSSLVTQQVRVINRSLVNQAKTCNIPFFRVMSGSLSMESYFMNHTDYAALMGDNVGILDRMMKHAICDYLTVDIHENIKDSSGFIGVWDVYTIYNIAAVVTTIMKSDSSDDLYLTSHQYEVISDEDLAKLPTGTYMKFTEYNPTRFMQILLQIRQVILDTMAGIMKDGLPNAFLSPNLQGTALMMKHAELFEETMRDAIHAADEELKRLNPEYTMDTPATEKMISRIAEATEEPFITMIIALLTNSGLSENVINLALGTSRFHIVFDDPKDKKIGDIKLTFMLRHGEEKPISVASSYQVKDMFDLVMHLDKVTKKVKKTIGTALRAAILNFTTFVVNVYFATMDENAKAREIDEADVEDVDIDSDLLDSLD